MARPMTVPPDPARPERPPDPGDSTLDPRSSALWDVLAPSTDPRDPLASINLVSALPAGPVALEIACEHQRLRLLARAWDEPTGQALAASVHGAFPQARLAPVAPEDDPARPATPGEHCRALELTLRDPEYFPLRTYDRDAAERQGDPLALLVRALQGLDPGERCLLRLTLTPAAAGWARAYRPLLHAARRADEHGHADPRPERPAGRGGDQGLGFLLLLGALLAGLWAWPVVAAIRQGQPPPGPLGALPWAWLTTLHPVVLGIGGGLALALLLGPLLLLTRLVRRPRELPTPTLLMTKLNAPGCLARLHVIAWGPDPARPVARLRRVTAVLPLYARADGNALVARATRARDPRTAPRLRRVGRRARILTAFELAGLWGPVGGLADAGDLVRSGSTRRRPPRFAPDGRPWLADGCPLGVSEQGGARLPIAFPDELYERVTLVTGKTGAGKSTALHHLLAHAMADPARGVVVIDPHGDLARALLGLIPPHRRRDVISVDLSDAAHPVGLNLLDVTTGRPPDRIAADTITSLRRLWPNTWGDRMEQMLRQAVLTLAELNRSLPPDQQFTLLQVEPLLQDPYFRRAALRQLGPPPSNLAWWTDYYDLVSARLREEMINPVLTKMATFATLTAARHIIGQPRATLDLGQAVRDHRIVIVNLAKGVIGGDLAALLGALLVSAVDLAIERQAALPAAERRRVLVAIDELQALPAIDYARLVGELRKFGGGFLLATQTLSGLDRLDPALRPLLLGNNEGLLTFRVAAEDARLLAPELDDLVTVTDLINLERGCAYLKASERGQPAPATWLRVHPPAPPDPTAAAALHARGRAAWSVAAEEAARQVVAARAWVRALAELGLVEQAHARAAVPPGPAGDPPTSAADPPGRRARRGRSAARVDRLLPLPDAATSTDAADSATPNDDDPATDPSPAAD